MKILDIQQGGENGDQWHEERHGCVTGTKLESSIGACYSNAKDQWVMGGKTWELQDDKMVCIKDGDQTKVSRDKQITMLLEIASDRQSIVEISDFQTSEMERGTLLEPLSIAATGEKFKIKLVTCGMLVSDTLPEFKFSPDAVYYNSKGVITGGAETKSKMGKKHLEYILADRVPPEHLLQCLCPMIMDDSVKFWIFSHFDDRNMVNNLFTKTIKRENYEEFIQVARSLLIEFLAEVDETVKKLGGVYNG